MVTPTSVICVRNKSLFKLQRMQSKIRERLVEKNQTARISYTDLVDYLLERVDENEVIDAVFQRKSK